MTLEQYVFAQACIKELQNPVLQPLGLALAWELNELMTQCAEYEEQRDRELTEPETESEWYAFNREERGWPGDGSGEHDFEDYNQNEGNDW